MHSSDTIAAIATAPGPAGIAIVRLSGPACLQIADRLVACAPPPPSRRPPGTVVRGTVRSDGQLLDEALILVMRAPRSYTREDVVEIQCHGGSQPAARILKAVLKAGARPAEPGEFTRRAFLNGRLDLVQAEAVIDLIQAQSERSAAAALEQLEGRLSKSFHALYDSLIALCTELEAHLDFSDDELPDSLIPDAIQSLGNVRNRIEALLETAQGGHILREGLLVVISGQPNVGKSTLFNALLGKPRAIVSPIPGTTRDTIEETLLIDGIPVRLVDTAGLRESSCEVEREGVMRAQQHIARADRHLYVIDASKPLDSNDIKIAESLDPATTLMVFNKIDLGIKTDIEAYPKSFERVLTQLLEDKGAEEILSLLKSSLLTSYNIDNKAFISLRHQSALQKAMEDVSIAIQRLSDNRQDQVVLAIENIRFAAESVGSITGRSYHEELLSSIFSKFCVGK